MRDTEFQVLSEPEGLAVYEYPGHPPIFLIFDLSRTPALEDVRAQLEYQGADLDLSSQGRVRVRVAPEHADEAFALLLQGGEFIALPNNEYLLTRDMVEALREAEFSFSVINSEAA